MIRPPPHCRRYAETMQAALGLGPKSLVIEVASNDGYLLQFYRQRGIPVLGIEPAANIAELARGKGIATLSEFFDEALAARLAAEGRLADLIHAHNVFAHVPDPNPFWRVENGVLMGENDEKRKGHVLYTEKLYKNFVLETEVRWSGEIDSGIMLRKPELQLQFGVSRSLKKDMSCSFYVGREGYPPEAQAHDVEKYWRQDDWNRVRLQAKGDIFTVWLNGHQVCQYTNSKYSEPGPIGLQIHPGLKMKVEYRNLRLSEME